ncbi:endonuclease domain-containing 1 protein-like [Ornithorhynchus anatinus]|uniref:Endonuclease domain containing 1 n=1 Tax=Ornithorhynchus anatinus TaxID=9258 RepID=K7E841_ORNAN|nr:endonuclease domain-containing 1 protein-like [Ornithorhynchus anatinus]
MRTWVFLPLCSILAIPRLSEGRIVKEDEKGFAECNRFFYEGTPPEGWTEPFHVKICQRFGRGERFATLYSTRHKIPVYSAFRYSKPGGSREESWMIEPQLDDPHSDLEEMTQEAEAAGSIPNLGSQQALNKDYLDSGFQRGQLYPNSLNSNDFQAATFTLTNAAPMTQSFMERWYRSMESIVERALTPQCGNGDQLYLIAGAVPAAGRVGDAVAVPEFAWLAACCGLPGGWSMGFTKQAGDGDVVEDVMVRDLEQLLPSWPRLFRNNCGEADQDTEKVKKILEMVNQVQDEERRGQTSPGTQPLSTMRSLKSTQEQSELLREEGEEEGQAGQEVGKDPSLLRKGAGLVTTPFTKVFQLLYYLVWGTVKNLFSFLEYVIRQFLNVLWGGVHGLGSATLSYFTAIGEELVSIPWKVVQVLVRIIRGFLHILCCLLKSICRILSIPAGVLVDIASFPVYTLGVIPTVGKDIALGLGGSVSLLWDATFGVFGGLLQGLLSICSRIGYKVSPDSSGE